MKLKALMALLLPTVALGSVFVQGNYDNHTISECYSLAIEQKLDYVGWSDVQVNSVKKNLWSELWEVDFDEEGQKMIDFEGVALNDQTEVNGEANLILNEVVKRKIPKDAEIAVVDHSGDTYLECKVFHFEKAYTDETTVLLKNKRGKTLYKGSGEKVRSPYTSYQ